MIRPHDPNRDVDGSGHTNGIRAERAAKAVEAWRGDDAPDESNYRDLICDLMHLCDREGEDFDEQLRVGMSCYEEESYNEVPKDATPELLAALEALFEHCAMVHKHWGENCNSREAEAARMAGLAAIAKAKGGA